MKWGGRTGDPCTTTIFFKLESDFCLDIAPCNLVDVN
jgi:hypothetical protein